MATDATGPTTTALGIPKYNTAADIPSGKGFNAAMEVIDDLIEARGAAVPGASGVKVWNNTTKAWETPTGANGTKFLRDDGTFAAASRIVYGSVTTAGAINNAGSGNWTSTRTAAGRYTITFSPVFTTVPAVTIQISDGNDWSVAMLLGNATISTFSIETGTPNPSADVDNPFNFIAVGT